MREEAREAYLRQTTIPPAALGRLRARIGLALRTGPADPPRWRGMAVWMAVGASVAGLCLFAGVRGFADRPLGPSGPIDHVGLAFDGQGRVGGRRVHTMGRTERQTGFSAAPTQARNRSKVPSGLADGAMNLPCVAPAAGSPTRAGS